MALRKNVKLNQRFLSPYKIIYKAGEVAYKLLLPERTIIQPVFHVSLLKKKVSNNAFTTTTIILMTDKEMMKISLIAILDRKLTKKNNRVLVMILKQWSNLL